MNWLFLRGLSREKVHWYHFPEVFEKTLNCKVFCLDLPGVGSARSEAAPPTIEAINESLRKRWLKIRNERGEGADWGVLGMSLGGMVALHWAGSFSFGDFQRVVIINSSDVESGSVTERLRKRAWLKFLQLASTGDPYLREKRILEMSTRLISTQIPSLALEGAKQATKAINVWTVLQQMRAASSFRAPEYFDVPLLILASQGDRIVKSVCSQRLHERYPNSTLAIHPTAGHDIPLDDGTWVCEQVKNWLSD